ncbi:MAG: hypothetical protein ACREC8_00525, partial [Limisphaerales bacterium]
MKRFGAIILACAFSTAIFAADAPPSAQTPANSSAEKAVSNPAAQAQPAAASSEVEVLPPLAP